MYEYTSLNGSTRWEFEENQRANFLYSRTDAQLQDMIARELACAAKAEVSEYERCRNWILQAFDVVKRYPSDHNLMCARQWIGREWKGYKNARKLVKGF